MSAGTLLSNNPAGLALKTQSEANNNLYVATGNESDSLNCNCAAFLDPFPNQITWRSVSNLQHYCRVCNTQLNSCKQSRIHAEGKKHEKRLAYLKFCFENGAPTTSAPTVPSAPQQQSVLNANSTNDTLPVQTTEETKATPPTSTAPPPPIPPMLSQMYPSYLHYTAPPAAFYFPAQSYHPFPAPDFVAVPTAPPPNTPLGMPISSMSIPFYSNAQMSSNGGTPEKKHHKMRASGSEGHHGHHGHHAAKKIMAAKTPISGQGSSIASSRTSNSSHVLNCDLCSLTFPSLSVLNNHLKGSRHMRKVKSQVAYKQMKAAGMQFKQDQGEICCEVCRVSVNSSHQLQAHLAGHKHKVRCYKRGLDPNAALITPTSTPPSTAPSECSAPRSSVSSKYNKSSLLGLPPPKIPQSNQQATVALKSNNKQPGLLGEHPAVNALRGLLPLPVPKITTHVMNTKNSGNQGSLEKAKGQTMVKAKIRKAARPKQAKERRDSTTESDEATEGDCNPSKKELQIKAEENQKQESVIEPPKPQADFSSDEAKESDNSDNNMKNNNSDGSNKTSLKYTCDTCNVTSNSTTQLSQHMNSPKHHVKAAEGQTKSTVGPDKKLKEIPMLNMFLKTLQPSYYPASMTDPEKEADASAESSNTEVER